MARDSKLQGFDKSKEERAKESDFRRRGGEGEVARTVDQVMHERMARRPFLKIEEFDLSAVVDYGTMFYDKHGDGCCDRKNGEEGLKKEPIPKGDGDPGPWRRTENGKR